MPKSSKTLNLKIYDEYLESNMRRVLEGLVENLLLHKPDKDHIHDFCIEWLMKWHKDHDREQQEIRRLEAERDHIKQWRDSLRKQLDEKHAELAAVRADRRAT
eukprot:TRINITY_DN44670_c0_g1_i1.p1 TRINITY_DN44670_c0_g1~~TRINITY_DN44670_c0_g1_i1.p1  ORF type:complete len:120 (+),score=27.53 TRINITY_DN44670_c0_g1_i1:52-360(+)